MEAIKSLFSNYVLNVALLSWFSAQVLKTIIDFVKNKKLNAERMVGAGGMPSCHTASVCALTLAVSRSEGFASPLFAIAFMFAAVVIYDAMGVRRAAGEHAKVINIMVRRGITGVDYVPPKRRRTQEDKELKEHLGHTPFEVLGGAMLGILVALLVPMV